MKVLRVVFALFILASASIHWQCNSSKKAATNKTPVIPDMIIKTDFNPTELGAYTTIDTAIITGDVLTLKVSYSGGCEEHKFSLYTNRKYKESEPPQLKLYLVHDDNGDACREMKSETLSYNIPSAKYTKSSHKVKLRINDYEPVIMYNY